MTPELRVVFEDDRLIAVDKPAGTIVIPGRGAGEGVPLVESVSVRIGSKAFVVHRIDRETSGVVLFAKDARAHKALSVAFAERSVAKTYLALVLGRPEGDGRIDSPLKVFGSGRTAPAADGKPSRTDFRLDRCGERVSLLGVFPKTGRRHQIRAHLCSIGHPVIGDGLYGSPRPVGGASRLMLHARSLALPAGVLPGSARGRISAEPGADFDAVLREFGL